MIDATRINRPTVTLACEEPALAETARALAQELGISVQDDGRETGLLLVLTAHGLELRDASEPRMGPVRADFSQLDLRPYSPSLSRRQPLARAFGKRVRYIVDATAGYAQDALLLALMGFRVTAIERAPVVAALARDGLRRLETQSGTALAARLQLLAGDARRLLPALAPRPDAVYIDPMFPPKRRKSAAARKEMRLLRELVGDDPDAVELLHIARGVAADRVVVKRPDDAPPLAPDPDVIFSGKLVRYDVYLAARQAA
jgi:16S rRNA (guanine1516-N2)-methyltransferase